MRRLGGAPVLPSAAAGQPTPEPPRRFARLGIELVPGPPGLTLTATAGRDLTPELVGRPDWKELPQRENPALPSGGTLDLASFRPWDQPDAALPEIGGAA